MPALNNISVVIPMHNAEKTIVQCLDSVYSKLKGIKEVIVVDDCSSDSSVKAVSRFPCTILKMDGRGFPGRARNLGARESRGEYILFIDSDVVLRDDISWKIEKYIRPEKKVIALVGIFSEEHPNTDIVSQYKNLHARYKYYVLPDFISSLHTSITAIDREYFWKVGGFNENSRVEDVELGERIVRSGYRIYFDRDMDVIHLKRYTLGQMLSTDFWKTRALAHHFWKLRDRKRIFREGVVNDISLYLFLSMLGASGFLVFLSMGVFFKILFIPAFFSLICFILSNRGFWGYLIRVKGVRFALSSVVITLIDMNCAFLAVLAALLDIFSYFLRYQRQ